MGLPEENIEVEVETLGQTFNLPTKELVGSVHRILMDKRRGDIALGTWGNLSEEAQQREINDFAVFSKDIVNGIIQVVATGDFDVIHAQFDNVTLKADGKLSIKAAGNASDEALVQLNHARGKLLKIIVVDENQFDQHRETIRPDADQPDMLEEEHAKTGDDDTEIVDAETGEILSEDNKTEQFKGGFDSRMGGYPLSENPFEETTMDAGEWADGWAAAHDLSTAPELISEPGEVAEALTEDDVDHDLRGYADRSDGKAPASGFSDDTDEHKEYMTGYDRAKENEKDA